ncbi:MAG: response regulator [Chitinispirillales bacterium]|jgi:CheY-like chemotaxis protein/anti-sigma regulatory factor (Ser/Thr protein kinase)|nr:response regulator [Chitinispirillales bacterium]
MFVDDEDYIRSMLSAYFGDKFDIVTAGGAAQALALLEREAFDLVVSDINMPEMDGPGFLREVHRNFPKVRTALLTSSDIDEYVDFARGSAVCSVIPKAIPFNFAEVERIITGLLTGEIFGLGRYLRPEDGVVAGTYCVKSSGEAHIVRDRIVEGIEGKFSNSGDTRLVLDEILTNAVYHAPTREDGSEKYALFSEVALEPSEYVYVEFGYDSEKYGVSVLDKRGALTRETILSKMERQIKGEGDMDDSGRGLHMCRLFADRLIVNIERGKRTEVVVLNFLNGKYSGYKPLYINEV